MRSSNRNVRACAAVLAAFVSLSLLSQPAVAGSEHGHQREAAHAPEPTRVPRISAESESYGLVGSLNDGVLSLRLTRKPDGALVTGAHIELTIDGESGEAREVGKGVYTYRSTALNEDSAHEVIIAIKEGAKSDLLIGALRQNDADGAHAGHRDHAGDGDHAEHGAHAGHDDHSGNGGHSGHAGEGAVKLTPDVMREFGVATEPVAPGVIARSITRPAEVSFNMDRFTHLVPRVAGIAKSINARQGDTVESGQVLAVLESRELAELKAGYLAAIERLEFAKDGFELVEALKKKKIVYQRSYLTSRKTFAEARIALRTAKQKLNSIGIGDDILAAITEEPDSMLTQYVLRAPMSGMIVRRHLVQGELVTSEREAFVIADTSSVWLNISLYSGDLPDVDAGQHVRLETDNGNVAEGKISFVSPDVSEQTRTATARVVLKGASRTFRPGMFIKATIDVAKEKVPLRIPKSALQTIDGEEVVFVNEAGEFKPRPVKIGRRNGRYAEIVSGLKAGDVIAAKGAFLIKSQLSKASFGDGHNH